MAEFTEPSPPADASRSTGEAASRRPMDGILIVRKDTGHTSHDIVALVRRLTGTRRVGHGGTLDPFASGVLPVFVGLATRLVEYHMADDKAYRATICFGATSETDDRDGELVWTGVMAPTREAVEAALAEFRGPLLQRPPDYSALKVGGRRAYQLARQGTPADLAPRPVTIHRLELVEWDATDASRPLATVEVECGAGTYIRSLARDLGARLGCGAYLGALTRTASGPFKLAAAHSLDEVRGAAAGGPAAVASLMLPIDAGLQGMPNATLSAAEVLAIAKGQQVKPEQRPNVEAGARVRLIAEDRSLVGIGSWKAGRLVPEKIFVPAPGAPRDDQGDTGPALRAVVESPLRVIKPRNRMVVVPGIDALTPDLGRLYMAVGVFDGLHRGHQYLLRELRHAAEKAGARPAIVTFDAHPEEVIEGLAPPLLCDPDERLVRLQAAAIEIAVVQHFDHDLRMTTYEQFVARIASQVDLAGFAMTADAAFGYQRGGTAETLTQLGDRAGFEVTVVTNYLLDGEQVRSSDIRRRVAEGDLVSARRLLGRPLAVTGSLAAERTPGEAAALSFEVPACLPPDGRFAALLGPAWRPGSPAIPAARAAIASISAARLELDQVDGLPGGAIRVVFPGTALEA